MVVEVVGQIHLLVQLQQVVLVVEEELILLCLMVLVLLLIKELEVLVVEVMVGIVGGS